MKHEFRALRHALDVLRVRHLALDEQGFGFRARDAHDAPFEGLRGGDDGQPGRAARRVRGARRGERGGDGRGGELLGEHGGDRGRRRLTARAREAKI